MDLTLKTRGPAVWRLLSWPAAPLWMAVILLGSTPAMAHAQQGQIKAQQSDARYNQLLRTAARQTSLGQHGPALATYKSMLAAYPGDLTATRGYADALMALGQIDQAEEFLTSALKTSGDDPAIRRSLGEIHRSQKKYVLYLEDVVAVLDNAAEGADLSLPWAMRAFEELSAEASVAPRIEPAIRKLISSNPKHPELRILLGDALLRRGEETAALAEVVEADRLSGAKGSVIYLFGDGLFTSGRNALAANAYQKAAELGVDPAFRTGAWTRVAEIAMEQNRYAQAASAYRAIADTNPDNAAGVAALLTLADIQSTRLGDYRSALATYQGLLGHPRVGDRVGFVHLQLADCHLRLNETDAARRELEKLKATTADQETQAEGAFLGAEILFFAGSFKEAQTAYQDVAENFTRTQKANDAVGRYLQVVRATDQGQMAALKMYADMERLTRIADTTAVIATAHGLVGSWPGTEFAAEALFREAEVLRNRGDAASVIVLCERTAAEYPKSRVAPHALAFMGDLYLNELGDKKMALETYERLLADYPENLLSAEVRRTVERLRKTSES